MSWACSHAFVSCYYLGWLQMRVRTIFLLWDSMLIQISLNLSILLNLLRLLIHYHWHYHRIGFKWELLVQNYIWCFSEIHLWSTLNNKINSLIWLIYFWKFFFVSLNWTYLFIKRDHILEYFVTVEFSSLDLFYTFFDQKYSHF